MCTGAAVEVNELWHWCGLNFFVSGFWDFSNATTADDRLHYFQMMLLSSWFFFVFKYYNFRKWRGAATIADPLDKEQHNNRLI
jgi:hypothetical protein